MTIHSENKQNNQKFRVHASQQQHFRTLSLLQSLLNRSKQQLAASFTTESKQQLLPS